MSKKRRVFYRYSDSFKAQIVAEVSNGSSISEVCRKYNIKGGSTVQKWLKKYNRPDLLNTIIRIKTKGDMDRIKELEAEVKRLKIALADSVLINGALETLIEIANEEYGTDLKKNFGIEPLADIQKKIKVK